jgi:LuxR family maltose regulon positive regulatory protein
MQLSEPLSHSVVRHVARLAKVVDPSMPVAAMKVRIPTATTTVLPRENLHALLDAAAGISADSGPVTVVCAPAGTGKTTMLASWARRRTECGDSYVAWVCLDSEDDDPILLWSAILRALRDSGAWERGGPLDALTPPPGEPYAAFLAGVIAAIDRLVKPIVLVLDDVHEVRSASAVRTLNFLLRYAPAMLRIVLATRFPPALNLARLMLEGRLREIGAGELAFSAEEARLLYAQEGIRLTDADLRLLMERTQGWPAGLRFAAMTLDGTVQPARQITGFTGDKRIVADYLIDEVLARQPKDVQQFMLSTSVTQSFTAGLAAVLSRQQNVGHILDHLERAGIVECAQDGSQRWYRYHPLLGRCLRAELGRRRLSDRHQLNRTAAGWFLAAGDPLRSIVHALAGRDDELVTRLVTDHGLEQILRGRSGRLRRILDTAPAHVLARQPVAFVAAEATLDLGDLPAADRWLRGLAKAAHTQRSRAQLATVWLHRALVQGDIGAMLAKLQTTQAGHTGDHDLDLLALLHRGVAAAWTGNRQAAAADLQRAHDRATAEHRDAVALHSKVHLAAESDLTHLRELAESALRFAKSRGWARTSRCAYLYLLLGVVAYQQLDDQRARQLWTIAGSNRDGAPADPTIPLFARTLRAMVVFDHAEDPVSVTTTLQRQWQRVGDRNPSPALLAYVLPACQRMALRTGNQAWATELAERADALLYPCGERALLRAGLHAHTGRTRLARRLLESVLNGQDRTIVTPTLIDAWLLEAVLAHRIEDLQDAHEALARALAVAAPHHALRPFHEAGPTIRTLLADGAGRFGQLEPFAGTVLAGLPASAPDLTDGLTKREQALLAELPSMRTAEEIADSLFVSVNTVKTHLRGIYRKLGVNRRRDAITVARQRGLL